MSNYNFLLRRFGLLCLFLGGLPLFVNKVVNAEVSPQQSGLSWANVLKPLEEPEPPQKPRKGGSRPDDAVCMVSPDAPNETRILWSDRPLFLWQGKVNEVAVRRQGSKVYLWRHSVSVGTESTTYTGKPLEPGKTYQWVVNGTTFVSFRVMEAQQRKKIAEDLASLENQLQAQKTEAEGIALAKANYFAKAQLWSDVLQLAYSVPKPDANLVKIRQEIVVKLCS